MTRQTKALLGTVLSVIIQPIALRIQIIILGHNLTIIDINRPEERWFYILKTCHTFDEVLTSS